MEERGFNRGIIFLTLDPFDGAEPRLLRRSKEAPLRVNPEPFGCTRGLELVERQATALRPGSRRVDFTTKKYKIITIYFQ
jgi:hypothetical protein